MAAVFVPFTFTVTPTNGSESSDDTTLPVTFVWPRAKANTHKFINNNTVLFITVLTN